MNYKIALIRGDGIGPEVVEQAVIVLEAVGRKFNHSFSYEEVLLGGCATDATGKPYPDGTTEKCYRRAIRVCRVQLYVLSLRSCGVLLLLFHHKFVPCRQYLRRILVQIQEGLLISQSTSITSPVPF
jgi:hypothetical protein